MRNAKVAQLPGQFFTLAMRLMAGSVFVVVLAGAAHSARAEGHQGHGGGGHEAAGMTMFGGLPRQLDRLLGGLDATDAQRARIKQIVAAAALDLKAGRDAGRGLRENGMHLFTAPTVDAAAAESLRQQMNAQHDQTSKRTLQAMLDVADVLTPEQRAKLGERMKAQRAATNDRMQRMHDERSPQGPRSAVPPTPQPPASLK